MWRVMGVILYNKQSISVITYQSDSWGHWWRSVGVCALTCRRLRLQPLPWASRQVNRSGSQSREKLRKESIPSKHTSMSKQLLILFVASASPLSGSSSYREADGGTETAWCTPPPRKNNVWNQCAIIGINKHNWNNCYWSFSSTSCPL